MIYGHQAYTVPGSIANLEKMASNSLPSFNELLTSIPLPSEFKSRQSSVTSSSYDNVVSPQHQNNYISTISYGDNTAPRLRMVQVSPSTISHVSNQPPQQFIQPYSAYSYRPVASAAFNSPWVSSVAVVPGAPQIMDSSLVSPTSFNADFQNKIRSHSTSELMLTSNGVVLKDPKRKHVCKVCSRSFTTSGHLARHNRIHTGERKHVCPWPTCETRFARQDNCMQHYKTHTNGKNKRLKGGKLATKDFV